MEFITDRFDKAHQVIVMGIVIRTVNGIGLALVPQEGHQSVLLIQSKGCADHLHHVQIQIIGHAPALVQKTRTTDGSSQNKQLPTFLQQSLVHIFPCKGQGIITLDLVAIDHFPGYRQSHVKIEVPHILRRNPGFLHRAVARAVTVGLTCLDDNIKMLTG